MSFFSLFERSRESSQVCCAPSSPEYPIRSQAPEKFTPNPTDFFRSNQDLVSAIGNRTTEQSTATSYTAPDTTESRQHAKLTRKVGVGEIRIEKLLGSHGMVRNTLEYIKETKRFDF
jgi:hypothetical protein